MYDRLFETFEVKGLELKNRFTMAPLYLGYAREGGSVSTLLLEHYRLMAQSGVALVVVKTPPLIINVVAVPIVPSAPTLTRILKDCNVWLKRSR
jgi:2,4-dienoyl-CoA reductase-like NADH-dependent reductase (Old Yellow Enzyme family)